MKTAEETKHARGTIKTIVEKFVRGLITRQEQNEQIDKVLESYTKEVAEAQREACLNYVSTEAEDNSWGQIINCINDTPLVTDN